MRNQSDFVQQRYHQRYHHVIHSLRIFRISIFLCFWTLTIIYKEKYLISVKWSFHEEKHLYKYYGLIKDNIKLLVT